MVRTKGSLDNVKRKIRCDKGKTRKLYAGKPVKCPGGFLKYFHEHYGKDLEFTQMIREKSRIASTKAYKERGTEIKRREWEVIKNNPERYAKYKLRRNVRNAFKVYIREGKIFNSKQYGIDYQAIIEHLKPFPEDLSKYHIDHIRPLCSFTFLSEDGSTDLEEIKKAFAPGNLQWLTAQENKSKGGRWEI